VAAARQEVFPTLAEKVAEQGLPTVCGVRARVLALVLALAEALIRKEVHRRVHAAYDALEARLVARTPGSPVRYCATLFEGGAVVPEDEFGFALADGGFGRGWSSRFHALLHTLAAILHTKQTGWGVSDFSAHGQAATRSSAARTSTCRTSGPSSMPQQKRRRRRHRPGRKRRRRLRGARRFP
jgi:hypothetical protein